MEIIIEGRGIIIPNINSLKRLGAGHDGRVYKFEDKALKIVKYDQETREKKGLMTLEKILYFIEKCHMRRMTNPKEILNYTDGQFSGYSMKYVETTSKSFFEFQCKELLECVLELQADFEILNQINVAAKDINSGSYILSNDLLHLCDLDKYEIKPHYQAVAINRTALNYAIYHFLYLCYRSLFNDEIEKLERKILSEIIKVNSNRNNVVLHLTQELKPYLNATIREYYEDKRMFLKHKI